MSELKKINGPVNIVGELEATSLDINGNADISGDLTSRDITAGSYTRNAQTTLSILTDAQQSSILKFREDNDNYGFTFGYYGSPNNFVIKRNDNSSTGVDVMTIPRNSNNVTFTGEVIAASLDISGNADIDGTLNADGLDIDGNADISGNLNVSGNTTFGSNAFGGTYLGVGTNGITQWGGSRGIMTWGSGYSHIYASSGNVLKLGGGGSNNNIEIGGTNISINKPIVSTTTIQGTTLTGTSLDINGNADISGTLAVNGNSVLGYATGFRTINSSSYTMIGTVAGDRLSSIVELTLTGTSGSVVIAASFEITVMHSQDIFIKSTNGDYRDIKIKITSTDNEDFSIEAMHTQAVSDTTLEVCIFPKAGETCTVTATDPGYTGREHEHTAFEGTCFSATDGASTGHNVSILGTLSAWAFAMDGNTITGIDNASEFTNDDAHIMTSAAVEDKILSYGYGTGGGSGNGDMLLGTAQNITADKEYQDSVKAKFGNGGDLQIYHDGSNTYMQNATGTFHIDQIVDDGDIQFRCDNGSGGHTAYITLDGGLGYTTVQKLMMWGDNVQANWGASNDLQIYHDATDSYVSNTQNSGDLIIQNGANDKNVIFKCDDGSNGITPYITLNGYTEQVLIAKPTLLTSTLTVGVNDTGHDVKFFGATAGKYLQWDESADRLIFTDNTYLALGTGSDALVYHTGSHTYFGNYTGNLIIENNHNDGDIIFSTEDGSNGVTPYITLDGSDTVARVHVPLWISEYIVHIGDTNTYFGFSAADTFVVHAGATGHAELTITGTTATFAGNIALTGGGTIEAPSVGGGEDLTLKAAGMVNVIIDSNGNSADDQYFKVMKHTNTEIFSVKETGAATFAGTINVNNAGADKKISFDRTGGKGISIEHDANGMYFYNETDSSVMFQMFNAGKIATSGEIEGGSLDINGNADISGNLNLANNKGLTWAGPHSVRVEGNVLKMAASSGIQLQNHTNTLDGIGVYVGTGLDFGMYHDGTHTYLTNDSVAGSNLYIRNATDNGFIEFQGDNGTGGLDTYLRVDGTQHTIDVFKQTHFYDNVKAMFGSGNDLQIYHDGSNSYLQNVTGDLYIQNGANDKDVILRSDDGSGGQTAYITLDGSHAKTIMGKTVHFDDNVKIQMGSYASPDLEIYHDGTNSYVENKTGDFYIRNKAADKSIVFQADDGSSDGSSIETYFQCEGASGGGAPFTVFPDSSVAAFGSGHDLQIYHDGSNSYIKDGGTGSLFLQASDIFLKTNATENAIACASNGAVTLYYDNAAKLATVTGGVNVTGTLTATADVIAYSDERLKENVQTLDGKKVLEMRGVSFDRLDDGKSSSGVIAQELEKVAPELVVDDGDYKGVAYGNLVGYLIEAVKDQQKQIDELKAMINGNS